MEKKDKKTASDYFAFAGLAMIVVALVMFLYIFFANDGLNHVWTQWQKVKLFWPAIIALVIALSLLHTSRYKD